MMIVLCLLLVCAATLVFQRTGHRAGGRVIIAGSEVWRPDALALCDVKAEFCRTGDVREGARFFAHRVAAGRSAGAIVRAVVGSSPLPVRLACPRCIALRGAGRRYSQDVR
jgi:hypothetical protein